MIDPKELADQIEKFGLIAATLTKDEALIIAALRAYEPPARGLVPVEDAP